MQIIELLIIGNVGASPYALRFALEYFGYRVNTHYIATAQQVIDTFASVAEGSIVVIDAHGTEEGMVLDELAPEFAAQQAFIDRITAENFASFLNLPSCSVISLVCCLGEKAYADAFLNAGAKAYIGALGYPDGSAVLLYAQTLFYLMFNHKIPLSEAHQKASKIDEETGLFRLYSK